MKNARILLVGLVALWMAGASPVLADASKTPADAEPPPNTKMALKLAGLVTFVATSCPDLQTDYARFKRTVAALGMPASDLERVENRGIYLSYTMRYKEDVAKNCARALQDFGPGGTVVSDLVQSKSSKAPFKPAEPAPAKPHP